MPVSTVNQYLAVLPADRRQALNAVRKEINRSLPAGYQHGMQFGMIGWYVPLSTYPAGYGGNTKEPLPFVALGSQKSHMALYMMCFYGHPTLADWFTKEYKKSGKKLDMGKGCVRFKALDQLALDVVGRTVARVAPAQHVANYQAMRDALGKGKAKKPAANVANVANVAKKTKQKNNPGAAQRRVAPDGRARARSPARS